VKNKQIKAKRDRIDTLMADPNTTLGHKRASVRAIEIEEAKLYEEYLQRFSAKQKALQATKGQREAVRSP
jgi:hypothetical protein